MAKTMTAICRTPHRVRAEMYDGGGGSRWGLTSVQSDLRSNRQKARDVSPHIEREAMIEQLPEIDDPLTGEIIDTDSIDAMLDRFDALDEFNRKLNVTLLMLRTAIAAKSEGDANTRRVAGKHRRAKITMPAESFDRPTLKRLWNEYPELAQEFLRIESIGVKLVEYKKLVNTASDQEDFCAFRDALKAANCGRTGTPRIEIERVP